MRNEIKLDGLAKTMTELDDTMDACCSGSYSNPMRNFAKLLMGVSQSLIIGGNK